MNCLLASPHERQLHLYARREGDVHSGKVIEENVTLSERFGLWLTFYPFSQAGYLAILNQGLRNFVVHEAAIAEAQKHSLVWALERRSRSGWGACQFAKGWAGRGHEPPEFFSARRTTAVSSVLVNGDCVSSIK